MTNKKICPFSMSGTGGNNITFPYPQRCIEEKCMAWMPETTRQENHVPWGVTIDTVDYVTVTKNVLVPGHCRLIK